MKGSSTINCWLSRPKDGENERKGAYSQFAKSSKDCILLLLPYYYWVYSIGDFCLSQRLPIHPYDCVSFNNRYITANQYCIDMLCCEIVLILDPRVQFLTPTRYSLLAMSFCHHINPAKTMRDKRAK